MSATERQLTRREALIGSGLVGAGALAALVSGCGASPATAAASSGDSAVGLAGTWLEDVTLGDGSSHQAIALYTKDGGIASIPSLPANAFSAGFGAWVRMNDGYLVTTELFVFDSSGAATGILRIRSQITVDQTGDRASGQARFEMQPAGKTGFVAGGSARFTASRIKPVPL